MRVNIDEIKDDGLDRAWDVSREQVDELVRADQAGYRAEAAAHVRAHLDKVERRVLLRVQAAARVRAPCGRCLVPVELEVPVDFALTLVPAPEEEPAARGERDRPRTRVAGSFSPDQAEEESYAGREIDLDPFVREQIALALPGYPLCREGCLGLCPSCGQNLNEKACGCDRRVPDPRWAGLEKFRTKA